jgi:hypothetical protein
LALGFSGCSTVAPKKARFRVATVSVEITPPLGHPLMGGGIARSNRIEDPLFAKGAVILGGSAPVVLMSLDWCELRNDAFDRWRDAIAAAAGTERQRVLLSCVHVHDAPIADLNAQRILEQHGAIGRICDLSFHERTVRKVADAVKVCLSHAQPLTQYGIGQAKVERVASNRRFVTPDGKIHFSRTSSTRDRMAHLAPEGTIDPWLKSLSFWNGNQCLLTISAYATHPMSYYGQGGVSADFVGLARKRREEELPGTMQIYFSGCSGNVTAGKFNDGSAVNRLLLADRMHGAMAAAFDRSQMFSVDRILFRNATLQFEPRSSAGFSEQQLKARLESERPFEHCLAAFGLSWRERLKQQPAIDLPALDFGAAKFLLLPAESYVEFQLYAQSLAPDVSVITAGYGECAPGYIPIERAWQEQDSNLNDWCWIAPGAELHLKQAIETAMGG